MRRPLLRDRTKPEYVKVVAIAHRQVCDNEVLNGRFAMLKNIDAAFDVALRKRKNYTAGLYTKEALKQARNEQLVEEIITLE